MTARIQSIKTAAVCLVVQRHFNRRRLYLEKRYLLFRALIGEEEAYMERCFGEEYLAYKRRVNAVFPTLIR